MPALAHYKEALGEIDETIRQTKRAIAKSQELVRRLDRLIDGESRRKGYAAGAAVEPPPEIIIIIPCDRAHFTQVLMRSLLDAESARFTRLTG